MSTNTCRSHELEHLDFCIFSLLLSRCVAYSYFDVGAFFVLFYIAFYVLHVTRDDNICSYT